MNAYDYDRQVWVSGIEGDQLALKQTRDELALLKNPAQVDGYCKLIGIRDEHRANYIATMETQERRLMRLTKGEGMGA
jgi:hypothetical protein